MRRLQVRRLDPLQPPQPAQPSRPAAGGPAGQPSFQEALAGALAEQGLKFSRHAQERLAQRQIRLGPAEMQRLSGGVARAAAKGARDSLVLLDNLALVVSVPNRTVVTAVDGPHLKENVFTNIDSAVIV